MEPSIENAKVSLQGFELPCGYLDDSNNIHRDVTVREMNGEDEEMLLAKGITMSKKMDKLLVRCTESVGSFSGSSITQIIPDLTQGDRMYLFIALRRVTLGDEMPFECYCPECDEKNRLRVDLSELESKSMLDPAARFYDVTLPRSAKKVRMKVLTGRGEGAITRALEKGKDFATTAIFARIDSVDDAPATMGDIRTLPLADRNFLRDSWQDVEGGVDTSVEVTCPSCDAEYSVDLDVTQTGFLNPLAALRDWKKKSSS